MSANGGAGGHSGNRLCVLLAANRFSFALKREGEGAPPFFSIRQCTVTGEPVTAAAISHLASEEVTQLNNSRTPTKTRGEHPMTTTTTSLSVTHFDHLLFF